MPILLKDKKYTICVATADINNFFNGSIIDEDDFLIEFFDEKQNGIVYIAKQRVIWIRGARGE